MTTPTSFFVSGPKEAKNGILAKQALKATDLIHGMCTQLDFGSNMDRIPPGYTSSHWCAKKSLQITLGLELNQQHTLIYILICKCLCLGIMAKHMD